MLRIKMGTPPFLTMVLTDCSDSEMPQRIEDPYSWTSSSSEWLHIELIIDVRMLGISPTLFTSNSSLFLRVKKNFRQARASEW